MCQWTDHGAMPDLRGMNFSRRRVLRATGAAALTLAVAPAFGGTAHAAGRTILSSHGTGFCNLNFFLTSAMQLAQQDGVMLDLVMTPNFADQITFLGAGQADAGLIPYTSFIALEAAGAPVKIIAGGGIEGCTIVAQPGLDTPAKLKGKTLGTFQLNTLEILPYDWLKLHGVSYNDITVRYMGSTPEAVEAFKAGAIDVISAIEPYGTALVNDVKGAIMLSDGTDIYGKGYTDCVLVARTDLIEHNPDALKALIKGMLKAQLIAETQPEDVLTKLVGPYYKTSLENARIAMHKQPSVVDARSQTRFILDRTGSADRDGLHQEEARPERDRLDDPGTGDCREQGRLGQAEIQIGLAHHRMESLET